MAFDRQQVKLTATGYFGSTAPGNEIWSWGLKLSGTTSFDAAAHLADIDMAALSADIETFHQEPTVGISSACSFVTLKAAALDTLGAYITDAVEYQGNGVDGFGGDAAARLPNQVALVVSLRTVTSIGVAVRGRFYVPGVATDPAADGRLTAPQVANVVTAAKAMLDGINATAGANAEPATLQLMSDVGVSTPRSRAVTTVLVGDVYDTVQRRRNALAENYTGLALA